MKLLLLILVLGILSSCSLINFENIGVEELNRVSTLSQTKIYMCPQDNCLNVFLMFLDQAKSSIFCAFYELDKKEISDLLIEKDMIGIDVALVVDDYYFEEQSVLDLNRVGIDVKSDEKRGTKYNNYMHHKFCIVDGSKLLLSSANPSQNGMHYNNNNILEIDSKELSDEFQKEFNQLYSGLFGQNKKQNRNIKGIEFENETLDVYFCPQDNCAKAIIAVLNSSQEEILFANFVLTLDSVEETLVKKKKNGVNVSGVIETRMWNSKGSNAKELSNIFPLNRDTNPKTMHHKFFVVDSRYVVTGSMNPSSSGVNYNDEFLVVIDSTRLAKKYKMEFNTLVN